MDNRAKPSKDVPETAVLGLIEQETARILFRTSDSHEGRQHDHFTDRLML